MVNLKYSCRFDLRFLGLLLGLIAAVCSIGIAHAGISVTYESPSATTSTVAHTVIYDFNTNSTGVQSTYWLYSINSSNQANLDWMTNNLIVTNGVTNASLGSYSNLNVKIADKYGGAPSLTNSAVDTKYNAVVSGNTMTFTLNSPAQYFGMWWSAGDAHNTLEFLSNGVTVFTFTTADVISALAGNTNKSLYYGNPTTQFLGQNSGEPYAFLNFFGDSNTSFNEILLTQPVAATFESDNWTLRDPYYGAYTNEDPNNLPGTLVAAPEPSESLFLLLGLGAGPRCLLSTQGITKA